MASGAGSTLAQRMFRAELREEDRIRESAIARLTAFLAALCVLISFALTPLIGRPLALSLAGVMLLVLAWYLTAWQLTRRGIWHPGIAWANVVLEVSVLPMVFALDTRFSGPEYALSAPTMVMWGGMILLSGLRSRRTLAIAAGVLAAIEFLLVYFLYVSPRLAAEVPVAFQVPMILVRAFFLLATGLLTALVAHFMLRNAERALSAVRERDLFGKYLLHERIGAGGMAEVFRATYSPEGGFEKIVAVKRILPAYAESAEFAKLFRREAQFGSLLNHPNIVQVFDVGRFNDSLFLAMEYVDGLSLRTLLRRREGEPLPIAAVAYLGAELAGALDYMHKRAGPDGAPLNLVHRDINPPNLLLSRIGEVKLADFGIARAGGSAQHTRTDTVRGKAGYMAPEQVAGDPLDGRADLYALGLTLHEALTGEPVFDGSDEIALMKAALTRPIDPPSRSRAQIPPALDALVMGLLERVPSRRMSNALELRHQLSLLDGELAPYPRGQLALASAVQEALVKLPEPAELRTAPQAGPPSSSDAPTQTMTGLRRA